MPCRMYKLSSFCNLGKRNQNLNDNHAFNICPIFDTLMTHRTGYMHSPYHQTASYKDASFLKKNQETSLRSQ